MFSNVSLFNRPPVEVPSIFGGEVRPPVPFEFAKSVLGSCIRLPGTDGVSYFWVIDRSHIATDKGGVITVHSVGDAQGKRYSDTEFTGKEASNLRELGYQ